MGISPVDIFITVDKIPAPGQKANGVPGSLHTAGGGPAPNAACAFARLGGTASVITSLGDDYWADFIRKELDRFDVRHDQCIVRKKCPTALATAWITSKSGERTIVLDRHPRLFITPRDIRLSGLPHPALIMVDGRHVDADLKLVRWGRKIGARIMLDVGSVRNPVDDLFPYLDMLVCADEYACHYWRTRSPQTAAAKFKESGIPEVVVTAGIGGSYGLNAAGISHRQRAYKVKAIDVTGAGDVFHGAYLYGTLKEWALPHKMAFASAAAALKCLKPGARDGIPTYRQTQLFLSQRKPMYA